jgi:hypothetical protein
MQKFYVSQRLSRIGNDSISFGICQKGIITFLVLYYLVSYFPERKSVTLVQRYQGFFVAPAFGSDFYHLPQSKSTQGFGSRLVPVAWIVQAGYSVNKKQLHATDWFEENCMCMRIVERHAALRTTWVRVRPTTFF